MGWLHRVPGLDSAVPMLCPSYSGVPSCAWTLDPVPQGNCTGAQRCCAYNGQAAGGASFLGTCIDLTKEACVVPVGQGSPCVGQPCLDVCTLPKNLACTTVHTGFIDPGFCIDNSTKECCSMPSPPGNIDDPLVCERTKGESCARQYYQNDGICCSKGQVPCDGHYDGKAICCAAGQTCGYKGNYNGEPYCK